mgnify:FL=1
MEMYAAPVEGTYSYKTPNFDGTFSVQQVKVSVLGESEKQYLIRLILPVGNHRQNDQMKVRKHNVRMHGMFATATVCKRPAYDLSGAWWNN